MCVAVYASQYCLHTTQGYSTYSIYLGPFLTKKNEKKKWFAWVLGDLMNQLKGVVRHLVRRISRQAVVRHLVKSAHEHSFFLQEYPWFALNCCNSAAPLCWQNIPYANLNKIKSKYVFKIKVNPDNTCRYKVRLVACGYS